MDGRDNGNGNTGAVISSGTAGVGDAGSVFVSSAGDISILNGAFIDSSTSGTGNASSVTIHSGGGLIVKGNSLFSLTGIYSQTNASGIGGDAGTVLITSQGDISLTGGGIVDTSTDNTGKAGDVTIHSGGGLLVDGRDQSFISAKSTGSQSSGETGQITITANTWVHLINGGVVSINNEAALSNATSAANIIPGMISITAPDITLQNSTITTTSTGNVGSGRITINPSHVLSLDPSAINTTANTGNGGSITINGSGAGIYLGGSEMLTTVNGANGNGGDIQIKAGALVMDTGLIKANALSGNGGNITLSVDSLIVSNNQLQKGGQRLLDAVWNANTNTFGFNVIQAVSATGISGAVDVAAPQINISGLLATLGGPQFSSSLVGSDYCALGAGSSLTRKGRGGMKRRAGNLTTF